MPLVSENWTKLFTWQGVGTMPAAERERLHAYVDHINTDDLDGLQEFLTEESGRR